MKWNFGVCTGHMDYNKLQNIADAGFDFFELNFAAIGNDDESHVKETVDFVKELKMYVPSMMQMLPVGHVITGEKADKARSVEFVERTIERAVKFGTKNYVFGCGEARVYSEDFPEEKVREQLDEFLLDILPIFSKHGCTVAIEALNRNECNIFNTGKEVISTIERLGKPNLKLLMDFYHIMYEGETLSDIESFGKHIAHAHIASLKNQRFIPQPDDGEDYQAWLDALVRSGYTSGNVSLEGRIGDGSKEVFERAINCLRKFK